MNFFAGPSGRDLTREETVHARKARAREEWQESPPAPPYFNDLLIQGDRKTECRVEALWWKHEQDDGVRYLPSSPLPQDIAIALGWLREEPFDWLQRFMWLLDGMREQLPSLSDVVIDLPPGLFGYAYETLALLSNLMLGKAFPSGYPTWSAEEWRGRAFLVTTEDRNDFLVALEYFRAHRIHLPHLKVILNRATTGRDAWFAGQVAKHFDGLKVEDFPLLRVDFLRPLAEVFVSGSLRMSEEVVRLRQELLEGSHAHP